MALKDWKEIVVQDDGYGVYIRFWNYNELDEINIQQSITGTKKYHVYFYIRSGKTSPVIVKVFDTKASALKYAKQYMRTH